MTHYQMLDELVDAGELVSLGDDYYEDMGCHIINGADRFTIRHYFESYFKCLSKSERLEIANKYKDDND